MAYIFMVENQYIRTTYPKLGRIKHNDYYLGLVQNLYCGKEGEIPSFLQFTYQCNILLPFGNDFHRLFSSVANEDLFHASLLCELIISLGGDPLYADNQGRWLGGRWVDYVKDIKQMLSLDIELKEKTVIDYKTTVSKIDDILIKQMLYAILKDEEATLEKLKNAFREIS